MCAGNYFKKFFAQGFYAQCLRTRFYAQGFTHNAFTSHIFEIKRDKHIPKILMFLSI